MKAYDFKVLLDPDETGGYPGFLSSRGRDAIRIFEHLGYSVVRQHGSHVGCAMRPIPRKAADDSGFSRLTEGSHDLSEPTALTLRSFPHMAS
jgi:hypothetical protein